MITPRDSASFILFIVLILSVSVCFGQTFSSKRIESIEEREITKQLHIAKQTGDVNKLRSCSMNWIR